MSRAAESVNRECGTAIVISVGSGELLGRLLSLNAITPQSTPRLIERDAARGKATSPVRYVEPQKLGQIPDRDNLGKRDAPRDRWQRD